MDDPMHLSVSRDSTVDSTTSTNSSLDDAAQDHHHHHPRCLETGCEEQRSPIHQGSTTPDDNERGVPGGEGERNINRTDNRKPCVGLRETRIIISQDDGGVVDGEGNMDGDGDTGGEDEEARKRAESLHKLHQQHALDSWDQEGDSASSSSRSSSTTRVSPRLSPSPSHRTHHPHGSPSSVPPNINNLVGLMCLGSTVLKVKRQGKTSSKMLYLDQTRTFIRWKPSKKGHRATINVKNIREIREGACTDTFKRHLTTTAGQAPAHCFSIIHGTGWASLDIVAGSLDEARAWVSGLRHLMQRAQEETEQSDQLRDSWLKSVFEAADKSGDGLLSMDEVLKLLHKLNVNLSKRKVKQLFREADTNIDEHLGKLDFDEFVHFYKTLSMRPELYALLREYSCGKEYMALDDVDLFLRTEQGATNVDEETCRNLIERHEPVPENVCAGRLGIDGLMRYFLGEEGDIFNPVHRKVNQDMTQPLCHYYIASSHNTYLLGDQLMSQSSVDVYGLVLQAGCRCVELDTWDGKDGEPVIYHGYTLTTKVKFRDVITVVNKYAFVSSPYPVILSIENHCSLDQQRKMASCLLDILGDQLIIAIPSDTEQDGLPSPESLKYKILIKAKKLPLDHDSELDAGEVSEEDSADELDEDFKLEKTEMRSKFESIAMAQLALMKKKPISPSQQAWQKIAHKRLERLKALLDSNEIKESNSENKTSSKNGRTGLSGTFRKLKSTRRRAKLQHSSESENSSMEYDRSSSRDDDLEGGPNDSPNQSELRKQRLSSANRKRAFVLSRQLSDLVKYTRSVAFKGFPENMPWWELPSLGEMRANNLAATRASELAAFTTHNLCRVYPSAYRIDSSNFNPQPMWNCGCQLVALNYQTEGRAMQLQRAKFRVNGSCGYVLKPHILTQDQVGFDPSATNPVPNVKRKQLTIHIISGQQLPKPPQSLLGERGEIIDPYVEVEVIGLSGDCTKAQTKTVQDNGFNPMWDCILTFPVTLPELTMVRFLVWDEDPIGRDFIGQATYPFSSLCEGYRHIHLEGLDHATIFVHVSIEDSMDKQKYVKNSRGLRSTSITRSTSSPSRSRTKSMDTEISLLTGGSAGGSPSHHGASPKRRTSLAERLGIRRRHSTTALLVEGILTVAGGGSGSGGSGGTKSGGGAGGGGGGSGGIKSPTSPTHTPTFGLLRQKRRSYEGEIRKGRSQGDEENKEDVFGEEECDFIPIDCEAVMELITSSDVSVELEADGSMSAPLNEVPLILKLGISPAQIMQVIQDGLLSFRTPSIEPLPISNDNSWDHSEESPNTEISRLDRDEPNANTQTSKWDNDKSTYENNPPSDIEDGGLEGGLPEMCVIHDNDVFQTNNNDFSTEIEALLSARFTKQKLAYMIGSCEECSSTEECCSSLGSMEDIPAGSDPGGPVTDQSGDYYSLDGELKIPDIPSTLTNQASEMKSESAMLEGNTSAETQSNTLGTPDIKDDVSDYDNNDFYDAEESEVLHSTQSHVFLPDRNTSTLSPVQESPSSSNGMEIPVSHWKGNPASDVSGMPLTDADSAQTHLETLAKQTSLATEATNLDHPDRQCIVLDRVQPQPQGHIQNQFPCEGQDQGHLQLPAKSVAQRTSSGELRALSSVVDSLFDLAASLAAEEKELQNNEQEQDDTGMSKEMDDSVKSSDEESRIDESLARNEVSRENCPESIDVSEEATGKEECEALASTEHTPTKRSAKGSLEEQVDDDPPESWNDQARPLVPTGLSPETALLRGQQSLDSTADTSSKEKLFRQNSSPSATTHKIPDDSVQEKSGKIAFRRRSLGKVFSSLLQKYDLFDGKRSETFGKGIRSSLRRKFVTRSVPDISNMILKDGDMMDEKDKADSCERERSSSSQEIWEAEQLSKSSDNLSGILEESLTSRSSRIFTSLEDFSDMTSREFHCSLGDSDGETSRTCLYFDESINLPQRQQDKPCSPIHARKVMNTEKGTQTEAEPLSTHHVDSSPVVGRWHRNGHPTRPLSCPVLPQQMSPDANKCRIVYFQENPSVTPPDFPNSKTDLNSQWETAKVISEEAEETFLTVDDMRETLADVSSDDPEVEDENDSSHICVVKGCNCAVNDLSALLDSSLLMETCFTGEEDVTGKDAEHSTPKGAKQEASLKGKHHILKDGIVTKDEHTDVAATLSERDSVGDGRRSDVGHAISSIHTHLGGKHRSIGTFRSEYNRSFDEDNGSSGEGSTSSLEPSPQKVEDPNKLTTEGNAPIPEPEKSSSGAESASGKETDIFNDILSLGRTIPLATISDELLSSDTDTLCQVADLEEDSQILTQDTDTSLPMSCATDLEGESQILTQDTDASLPTSCAEEMDEKDSDPDTNSVEDARTKDWDLSFDMVKSLEALSTALDVELSQRKNETEDSISESSKPDLVDTPTCISPGFRIPTSTVQTENTQSCESQTKDNSCTITCQEVLHHPSEGTPSTVLPTCKKTMPSALEGTVLLRTRHRSPLRRPEIGGAISVRFLSQIPRQMSAYTYSDSDSDYDSTASGSSQETVVEVIATHPLPKRSKVKPPVPPKSYKLKQHIIAKRAGSGKKPARPPVPPKPANLKALLAEKRAREASKNGAKASGTVPTAKAADTVSTSVPPGQSPTSTSAIHETKQTVTVKETMRDRNQGKVSGGHLGQDRNSARGKGPVEKLCNQQKESAASRLSSHGSLQSSMDTPQGTTISPMPVPHRSRTGSSCEDKAKTEIDAMFLANIGSKYNVTMRKRSARPKPTLEHRHSTGSLFSFASLPVSEGQAARTVGQKVCRERGYPDQWNQPLASWSLDRKKRSNQRVYFMLNV